MLEQAMSKIIYSTENKELLQTGEKNLLELCLKQGVSIDHACEGGASCGTCRVLIESDPKDLPARNSLEQEMALDRGFQSHERLACQLPLTKAFRFKLPKD